MVKKKDEDDQDNEMGKVAGKVMASADMAASPMPLCRAQHPKFIDIQCDLVPGHRGDHQVTREDDIPGGGRTVIRWPDAAEATIRGMFHFHPPASDQVKIDHETVRSLLGHTAEQMRQLLPESNEANWAIIKLRESMFWANAAIAIHHTDNQEVANAVD